MRKLVLGVVGACVLASGIAHAQFGIAENPSKAVEQMILMRTAEEAEMDSYAFGEILEGYATYREAMDVLEARQKELKTDLKAAIEEGETGYAVQEKVNALMAVDREILQTKQGAIREAGTVLDGATTARLYLILSDMDKVVAQVGAALSGKAATPCGKPMPCCKSGVCPCVKAAAGQEAGMAPEEAIMLGLKEFGERMAAKEFEEALESFSDDFSHYDFGDKQGFLYFLKDAASMGDLDGLEIGLDDTEIEVEDDEATVYPIAISGMFGSADVELVLKNEDGDWKVVGMELEGI